MYKLTLSNECVERLSDNTFISFDPANTDYTAYLVWLSEGNTPISADIPPAPTYQELRAAEYPPIEDYLDGVVKGDQAQIDAYIAACQAVKAKYPKGE